MATIDNCMASMLLWHMQSDQQSMTTMNISLPEALRLFVAERANGRFGSASEYVRELIRADQRHAAGERLEALLIGGLESGAPIEAASDFWEHKRAALRERHDVDTRS